MQAWQKIIIIAALATIITVAGTIIYFNYFAKTRLIISTTTSLFDTGILDEIEKRYEALYNVDINIISAGTGIAIQHAQNGDADVILVHAPAQELIFLEEGYGVNRKIIAYNFFTICGPESDPAGIKGKTANDALNSIVAYGESMSDQSGQTKIWISRGDNSGTHSKERSLWSAAGYNYTLISAEPWYGSAGSGMGDTLNVANQLSAYTLADIGTYLKFYTDRIISLPALITEEESLLNVYSVMAVNPNVHTHVNYDDAMTFIQFLVSEETQQFITEFAKDSYEQSLFYGASQPLKTNSPLPLVQWIRDAAFFSGSECPPEFRLGFPELYT
jgi:tungstate transport system substrate-binding protein